MCKSDKKDITENYVKTNGEITFVGRSGTGRFARTLLIVKCNYDNVIYTGTIERAYKKDGYYKIGDTIIVNINKNNREIK